MTGTTDPTWVIRLSGNELPSAYGIAVALAQSLAQGCDVQSGFGVWDGEVEPSVTVTIQADEYTYYQALAHLANILPYSIRWAHVEKHTPEMLYEDLRAIGRVEPRRRNR